MGKKFLKQYEIFYKKAVIDFNMATIALKEFEKGEIVLDLEAICFHLQQCTEKLIKAVLDFNQIKFSRTHDLSLLIKYLDDNNIDTLPKVKDLIPLSDFAVEGRYSMIVDDLDEVDSYFKILDNLLELAKSELKVS